jgi:hypothetical protein
MKLRVSTDNIGLARLHEGLELVRIGAPLLPEFAAWRYGDQFGRRRRKHFIVVGAGIAVGVAVPLVPVLVGIASIVGAMNLANLSLQMTQTIRWRRRDKRICAAVRDDAGQLIPLTMQHICCAALVRSVNADGSLYLALPHGKPLSIDERDKAANRRGIAASFEGYSQLTGAAVTRALGTMLPQLNAHGASKVSVREAVAVVNSSPDAEHLIRESTANTGARMRTFGVKEGQTYMQALPSPIRLALEMMLHQDDERRAMEGELHELELRWRDADAIASIADSLTLPPDIDERLAALRNAASVSDRDGRVAQNRETS